MSSMQTPYYSVLFTALYAYFRGQDQGIKITVLSAVDVPAERRYQEEQPEHALRRCGVQRSMTPLSPPWYRPRWPYPWAYSTQPDREFCVSAA